MRRRAVGMTWAVLLAAGAPTAVSSQNLGELLQRKYDILQQQADTERMRAEAEAERARAETEAMSASSRRSPNQGSYQVYQVPAYQPEISLEPSGVGPIYVRASDSAAIDAMNFYRIKQAAKQGDKSAQYNLGIIFMKGQDIPKNDIEAAKLLQPLAQEGSPQSEFAMGNLLYPGAFDIYPPQMAADSSDLPKNIVEARKWFGLAAQQGLVEAQFNLAVSYDDEAIPDRNYAEAARLYGQLASKGFDLAQINLSKMYLLGTGVQKNYLKAYIWASMAANQRGVAAERAVQNRDLAQRKLLPAQRQQAQAFIGRCLQTTYTDCPS